MNQNTRSGIMVVLALLFNAAHADTVKFTNNAAVPVAFVLVRTEQGSDYGKLYEWSDANKTKVVVLNPQESTTIPNFPQKTLEYDRALWIVPLSDSNKIE